MSTESPSAGAGLETRSNAALSRAASLGGGYLDLLALAAEVSVDEADNLRWALTRRTPVSASVYQRTPGVYWSALRALSPSGTIYWGRDDLVVHNVSGQDLYFVWTLGPAHVEINIVPVVVAGPLPPLANWPRSTVAAVYGRPYPGGWGSLGLTSIADHALHKART